MNIVGERICQIQKEQQLSADEISSRLSKHDCCLACIERSDTLPSIQALERIAEALGVPAHSLFYDDTQPLMLPHLPNRLSCDDLVERRRLDNERRGGKITTLFLAIAKRSTQNRKGGGT